MGVNKWNRKISGSYSSSSDYAPPNPNPYKFTILKCIEISGPNGSMCLVKVKYPGCTTFEGEKVLVFNGVDGDTIRELTKLDPHFSNNSTDISPIARFKPTKEGWEIARDFCEMMVS